MGGGLGSSAAMETAVARALQVLGRLQIDPIQMAILCQRAEIEFVGADCSIAEPFTALLGQAGCALCIDCRDLSSRQAPIPRDISVVLCDTRSQQQMPQALHRAIEADCQAGVSLITQRFPDIRSLRDVTQDQLRAVAAELSPAAVRRCRFVVEENGRALALAEALAGGDRSAIRQAMLASYSGAHDDLGITTDEMEQMMYAVLSSPGVIGARHTGRGFGGCVVALVDADEADLFVTDVARRYWSLTHIRAKITQVQVVDGAGLIEQQSVRR